MRNRCRRIAADRRPLQRNGAYRSRFRLRARIRRTGPDLRRPHARGAQSVPGTIEDAPFYAAKMMPSDAGMAGGLLTDEYARVITENGVPIDGLYASGT